LGLKDFVVVVVVVNKPSRRAADYIKKRKKPID